MKKIICITVLLLALSTSSVMSKGAFGSAFGTLSTAKSMGSGVGEFGLGLGIADATSFTGTFGYGMSQYIDGRIKLGLLSDNDETEITFGIDMKYQLWSVNDASSKPFDFALGGLLEYVSSDGWSVLQVGGFVLGSYPILLSNNQTLTPYGRFSLRLENVDYDGEGLGVGVSDSDSELEFGFNGGVAYSVSTNMTIFGEFQFDGNDGIFFGLDFRVL